MTTGVLLMAYGSPDRLEDVEPYLRDIRGGKPIRAGLLEDLTERYRRVGLPSPLLEITQRQAAGVQSALGEAFTVAVGMKHWQPSIHDGLGELLTTERVVGLALAPHYSTISIGGYASRVRAAIDDLAPELPFDMIESWYHDEAFVELVARNLREVMPAGDAHVFFTAHSLPQRILAEGDPYRDQLLSSAKLVADAAGASYHSFAFQSASETGEPWLGPDIRDALTQYAAEGGRRAVLCPIGFVTDHLEILYDLDVEAAEHAARLGLELRRVRSPNDDPAFVRALAGIVRRAAA